MENEEQQNEANQKKKEKKRKRNSVWMFNLFSFFDFVYINEWQYYVWWKLCLYKMWLWLIKLCVLYTCICENVYFICEIDSSIDTEKRESWLWVKIFASHIEIHHIQNVNAAHLYYTTPLIHQKINRGGLFSKSSPFIVFLSLSYLCTHFKSINIYPYKIHTFNTIQF